MIVEQVPKSVYQKIEDVRVVARMSYIRIEN